MDFENIPKEDVIKYILVFSIVIFFFTNFTNANMSTLIGISVAVLFILYDVNNKKNDVTTFNKDMEYKLKSLYDDEKIPTSFSSDSNMIELFSLINDYKDYNYSVYEKLVDRTNQFLELKTDVVDKNTDLVDYDFETAHNIYRNCMNYMRSFRHTLPPNLLDNHDLAEKRYQILMKRNLDQIKEKADRTPYSVYKKSTYYYDSVRPLDSYNEDDRTFFGAY